MKGAKAPSFIDFDLSGITNSESNFVKYPIPSHSLHCPNGLLNEKNLGEISGKVLSHLVQDKFLLKIFLILPDSKITTPSP